MLEVAAGALSQKLNLTNLWGVLPATELCDSLTYLHIIIDYNYKSQIAINLAEIAKHDMSI